MSIGEHRFSVDTWSARWAVFTTSAAAFGFLGFRIGFQGWPVLLAAGLLAATVSLLAPRLEARPPQDRRSSLLMVISVLLAAMWVLLLFHHGWALPPGDAIAVPEFARTIVEGSLLTEGYPEGSSGHAYPPGYPLLFAPFAAALPPLAMLAWFKGLTLASVVGIPLAWGWQHERLFPSRAWQWITIPLAYVMFFAVERTAAFAVPFAGKNAVLLALLLFPLVTVVTLKWAEHPWRWPLAVLPVFGLVLVHYTMLHLLTAFLGSFLLLRLLRDRSAWLIVLRIGGIGVLSVALLVFLNSAALSDPRAGTLAFEPLGGLTRLSALIGARRPATAIFLDHDFGLPSWPYRNLVLIAGAALGLWISRITGNRAIGQSVIVYLAALLISFAFAFGVVPAGISLDFMRWYAWPLQAVLFLAIALSLISLVASSPRRWVRAVGATASAGVACGSLVVLFLDGKSERYHFNHTAVRLDELEGMVRLLPKSVGSEGCFLIGQSDSASLEGVTVQKSPVWAYAEALSKCRFLNGSWVQPGVPSGRSVDGFPAASVLRSVSPRAEVFFVAEAPIFERYVTQVANEGVDWKWTHIDSVSPGMEVWRRRSSEDEQTD